MAVDFSSILALLSAALALEPFSLSQKSAIAAMLGLVCGSFLNVLIYRLPRMMERQWEAECAGFVAQQAPQTALDAAVDARATACENIFNLWSPASHCPACGHGVRWWENIPVMSFLYLRGRCSSCGSRISWRYPLVELATAGIFAWCIARWGWTPAGICWSVFATSLLALAFIDWDTLLLPDDITQPLLWAGLLASLPGWSGTTLTHAVLGAAAGYLSLWAVYWAFKIAAGKDAIGAGDFKMFAAIGAWMGYAPLAKSCWLHPFAGSFLVCAPGYWV